MICCCFFFFYWHGSLTQYHVLCDALFLQVYQSVCLGRKSRSVRFLIICLMQPIDAILKSIFWTLKLVHFQFSVHLCDATPVKAVETWDSVWSSWAVKLLLIKERGCLIFLEVLGRVAICAYYVRSSSVFFPPLWLSPYLQLYAFEESTCDQRLPQSGCFSSTDFAAFPQAVACSWLQPAEERRRRFTHHVTLVI